MTKIIIWNYNFAIKTPNILSGKKNDIYRKKKITLT